MQAKISKIRTALNLETDRWRPIFEAMDDELLLLSFLKAAKSGKEASLVRELLQIARIRYPGISFNLLEFLGDAVLQLITTVNLFDEFVIKLGPKSNEGILTNYRTTLVKNVTLFCHMTRKNLCQEIIPTSSDVTIKPCADTAEGLIGAIFYYLHYIKKLPNTFDIITEWFKDTFWVDESMQALREDNKGLYLTDCGVGDKADKCKAGCVLRSPVKPGLKSRRQLQTPKITQPVEVVKPTIYNCEGLFNLDQVPGLFIFSMPQSIPGVKILPRYKRNEDSTITAVLFLQDEQNPAKSILCVNVNELSQVQTIKPELIQAVNNYLA